MLYLTFSGFYWVLSGFTGFQWILLGFIRFYWILLGFTGFYQVLLGFTRFYWVLSGFTRFYQVLVRNVDIWDTLTCLPVDVRRTGGSFFFPSMETRKRGEKNFETWPAKTTPEPVKKKKELGKKHEGKNDDTRKKNDGKSKTNRGTTRLWPRLILSDGKVMESSAQLRAPLPRTKPLS